MVLSDDLNVKPRRPVASGSGPRSGVSEVAVGISRLSASYKHRLDDDDASSQVSSASKTRRGYYTVIFRADLIFIMILFRFLFWSMFSLATAILIGRLS